MIRSIHHVNIRARPDEVARLRHFYCAVLGLTEGWRPPFASRGHWLYAHDHPVVHLVEAGDAGPGSLPAQRSNVDHVAFQCDDLDSVLAKLRTLAIQHTISQVPVLGDTQILLHDPLGIGVELTFTAHR